jgi:hypothetical protein
VISGAFPINLRNFLETFESLRLATRYFKLHTYPQLSGNRQVRMIPIDHQIAPPSQQPPQPSNIIHVSSDRSLTKRSTSLPRKMSNEGIPIPGKCLKILAYNSQFSVKSPPGNLPSSPSKIRPPSQNHTGHPAAPHFQPPIPQRVPYEHKQTGHTHIS